MMKVHVQMAVVAAISFTAHESVLAVHVQMAVVDTISFTARVSMKPFWLKMPHRARGPSM